MLLAILEQKGGSTRMAHQFLVGLVAIKVGSADLDKTTGWRRTNYRPEADTPHPQGPAPPKEPRQEWGQRRRNAKRGEAPRSEAVPGGVEGGGARKKTKTECKANTDDAMRTYHYRCPKCDHHLTRRKPANIPMGPSRRKSLSSSAGAATTKATPDTSDAPCVRGLRETARTSAAEDTPTKPRPSTTRQG